MASRLISISNHITSFSPDDFTSATHAVENQADQDQDFNAFTGDVALVEGVERGGGFSIPSAEPTLTRLGGQVGSKEWSDKSRCVYREELKL